MCACMCVCVCVFVCVCVYVCVCVCVLIRNTKVHRKHVKQTNKIVKLCWSKSQDSASEQIQWTNSVGSHGHVTLILLDHMCMSR